MFTGEIVVGADQTVIDVVYDTGSDWLVIPDADCFSCEGTKHDSSQATPVDTETSSRAYGSAYLEGKTYTDTVCLDSLSTTCATDFEYFAFHYQTGLFEPVEGILGMCMGYQMILSAEEIEVGPLFAEALKDAGKVTTNEFSFAMNGMDADGSYVDFGPPKGTRIQGGLQSLVYMPFYEDFFWSVPWQGIAFGGDGYSAEGAYTIFDTGTSHIFLPPSMFEPFVMETLKEAGMPEYVIQYGIIFVECSSASKFKPIQMMFGDQWITINPKDYIWDALGDGRTCILLMMANSYEFALLGQPVFQGYYTHHDIAGTQIGYAPLRNSGQPPLFTGDVPTNSILNAGQVSNWSRGLVIFYWIGCAVLYYFVVGPWFNDRWDSDNSTESAYIQAATWGYGSVCYLVYHFILGPMLGISTGSLLAGLLTS